MSKLVAAFLLLTGPRVFATPLTDAINVGDRIAVATLLDDGADPNKADASGDGPLLQAISAGQDEMALLLIQRGASLDVRDGAKKENLLFETIRLGETDVLKVIIRRRPSLVNEANTDGETPLFEAVRSSQSLSARILLQAGAQRDARNNAGQVPADLLTDSDVKLKKVLSEPVSPGKPGFRHQRHHSGVEELDEPSDAN